MVSTRKTRKQKRTLDVRSPKEIEKLTSLLKQSPFTMILIYADWCPHCHDYLPIWDQFANLPGRNANTAKVHYDMQEKIPAIANAKINGYPSVIKVRPDGTIEEYKDESGITTNAVPNMRDKQEMMNNLMIKPISSTNLFGKHVANKLANTSKQLRRNKNADYAKEAAEEAMEAAAEATAAAKKLKHTLEKEKEEKKKKEEEAVEPVEEEEKEKEEEKERNERTDLPIVSADNILNTQIKLAKQKGGMYKQSALLFSGGNGELLKDLRRLARYKNDDLL
jgi:thiol-disulfide isomerase/thioredoxin